MALQKLDQGGLVGDVLRLPVMPDLDPLAQAGAAVEQHGLDLPVFVSEDGQHPISHAHRRPDRNPNEGRSRTTRLSFPVRADLRFQAGPRVRQRLRRRLDMPPQVGNLDRLLRFDLDRRGARG